MDIWKKSKVLGEGSFGTVSLACRGYSSSCDSSLMAVKSAHLHRQCAVASLKQEATFLKQLQGKPNIVHCFGEDISLENDRLVYSLLLEYAAGGTLADLIENTYNNRGSCIAETHVACYASMILRGLAQIHSQGIAHCDLKPANVLVFPVQGGGGISQLKITDFGLVWRVLDEEDVRVRGGISVYSSPGSLAYGLHHIYADIWAFGCIVFEMITGKNVRSMANLFREILEGKIQVPDPDGKLSKDGLDFLEKCLAREYSDRWCAEKLLKHSFIVKNLKMIRVADLKYREEQRLRKSPFGVCGWVSKRHLFSDWAPEAVPSR